MKAKNHNTPPLFFSKHFFISFGILFSLSFLPQISFAQFTYIGATTNFTNNLIGPSSGLGNADSRTMNYGLHINVKAIHRPLRFLGVGAEASFPLVQGTANSAYNFQFYGGDRPENFEYKAKQAYALTAIASLFADTDANFHVDFRFSYISFREEFEFERLGFMDFYEEKVNFPAAGFALGFMPHLSKHLFFDINLGFDFLLMGSDPAFSYEVGLDQFGQGLRFVTLESQLGGVRPSFFMNIGLGYFF